ncbi:4'-phosphopantetheinyl transferase EntD [Streptomyces sp. Amel2xB2]|uniref:4'-phosphopantetheinyl transferase family protein n=1 Tax=Streptomyces sp. Amel2xB2 TaxID=1305829 RepID=UPI000DBA5966|nr:4'-phosphopantetheinyl transferase superfamily protein [Streptomyces sp. Amel2xB2]RAJ56474.1 4'-phosphopantetheinyl transferase EntD [Streptomyces sp. Amel2xB2]
MIASLLPDEVYADESFGEGPDDGVGALFPEETAAVSGAVPKRRKEFAQVRSCARSALARLGVPPVPLVPGRRGAPRWPVGVVGSMTHCAGYRAAAVAREADAVGIGIDAEPDGPLPEGVLEAVSLPSERKALGALRARSAEVHWDRLLFSAKESVFKTWYPLTARELDFSEAEIAIDAEARTFVARLLVEGPVVGGARLRHFAGRWASEAGVLATAILLPHGRGADGPAPSPSGGG